MFNWPPPTLHPAANGVGRRLEGDGIELQDFNPDARVGVPIDVPSEVHPIPAVHPPVVSPPNPPSNPESPPPPSYTTLSDEDQSLKHIIPQRLDGAFVPFLFLMGCCLQLDRLLFFLCQPYFERILGLTEADFKLAAFIKEIAYFAAQVPSNLILSMLDKPATYLCVMLCFWAAVQIRLSYEYTLGHVCACCALLGVFESAFFPGFLHILSFIAGPVVRAIVAYALGSDFPDSGSDLAPIGASGRISLGYEYYLRISGMFVLLAALTGFWLPQLPRSTDWLSETERRVVVVRLAQSCRWPRTTEYENQRNSWHNSSRGLISAIIDPKTWLLASVCFCISFPIPYLSDLHHVHLLLTPIVPPDAISGWVVTISSLYCVVVFAGGYCAYKSEKRRDWLFTFQCVAFLFTSLTALTAITGQKPAGSLHLLVHVCLPCAYFCLPIAWAWLLNCLPWNRPKRAACIAIASSMLSLGNAYGIYTTPMDTHEIGRASILRHLGILITLEIGASVAVLVLGQVLVKSNQWIGRFQTGGNPELEHGSSNWTLGEEFSGDDLAFRFPV